MDLRRLRYFVAIAEARSMGAAAELLHVAQPALTKTMHALEDEFCAVLLQRSARGVTLTEAGERLYEHCHVILGQMERARRDVGAATRPAGQVSVGMPYSLMVVIGVPLLEAASRAAPGIRIELVQEQSHMLPARLRTGRLNVVLAAQRTSPGVVSETVATEEIVFLERGTRRRPRGPLTFAAAARRHFVLPNMANGLRLAAEAYFRSRSLRLMVTHEVDGISTIVRCVSAGLGASLLPLGCIVADPAAAGLTVQRLEGGCVRSIVLSRAAEVPLSPAACVVAQLLQQTVAELVSAGDWSGAALAR